METNSSIQSNISPQNESKIPENPEAKKEEIKTDTQTQALSSDETAKIKEGSDTLASTSVTGEEKSKEEKDQSTNIDNTINEYKFPIPNNSQKLEESKNSETYAPINFQNLNLKVQDSIRPKFKDTTQNNFYPNFNMSYFTPISFFCSLNTHSVNKYKNKPIQKEEEFLDKLIKIADVSNITEFWEVFQHLQKPSQCQIGSDYHIFKRGIYPMWEDKSNKDGGKLSVLLTFKYANIIWEEVAFNFSKGLLPYYDNINGIVISMRPKFMVLSFWIKYGNVSIVEKIRNALSGLLQTPSPNCFDFIPFH